MAKEIAAKVKLQVEAGKANPAPPVGTALGPHGINIQDFCSQFNSQTADKGGLTIPCVINIYKDRSFDFEIKSPPAAVLIKKMINLPKGSGVPHKDKVGTMTFAQCVEIGEMKKADLNARTPEAAGMMIAGTARQMGVVVEGAPEPKTKNKNK